MAELLITSPTGSARFCWPQLLIFVAAAMLTWTAGAAAAAVQDAAWKATTREVLKGLGRCYVEPRHKQSWRIVGDELVWETRSRGRVKVDRRAEVAIAIMEGARASRGSDPPGYPYVVEMRLGQAVLAAATVGGAANPDFNYTTTTLSCALRKAADAEHLTDALNRLIALAKKK